MPGELALCLLSILVIGAYSHDPDAIAPEENVAPLATGMTEEDAFDTLAKQTSDLLDQDLSPPPPSGALSDLEEQRILKAKEKQEKAETSAVHAEAAARVVVKKQKALSKKEDELKTLETAPPPTHVPIEQSPAKTLATASKPTELTAVAVTAQSCEASCATNFFSNEKSCSQQCSATDDECLDACAHPRYECACGCHKNKSWSCDQAACKCWSLQEEREGPVEEAMIEAENEALARGATADEARKQAKQAEKNIEAQLAQQGEEAASMPAQDMMEVNSEMRTWLQDKL